MSEENVPETTVEDPTEEPLILDELTVDEKNKLSTLMNQRVFSSNDIPIYQIVDSEYQEVGSLSANQMIILSSVEEISNKYIPLLNSNLYINGFDVELNPSITKLENHLLPYNQNCITTSEFELKDENGYLFMKFTSSMDFVVYVQEENRTGILYQERIFFIDNEDITQVYENGNTDLNEAVDVPVLMYHFFHSVDNGDEAQYGNQIEVSEFEAQLAWLRETNHTSLTMRELEYFIDGKARVPEGSFVITIDDGDPSVYQYAYPLLKEYNYNATLFLIAGWMEPMLPYEFIEMREAGLELQSHSFLMHDSGCNIGNHGKLQCAEIQAGIEDTIRSLEYVDGGFVYCYPFGDYGGNAIEIMKQSGVRMAFTTEHGVITQGMDKLTLPRVRISGGASIEGFKERLS